MMKRCANQVAVHLSYELDGNFLGANSFALAVIRATPEKLIAHGRDHAQSTAITLRLSLRQRVEMSHLRGGEKHSSPIGTGSDACAAADAGCRIKNGFRGIFWHQNVIGFRSA